MYVCMYVYIIYIYVQKGHVCMSFDGLKRIVTVRPKSILQSKCMYVRMFCLQSIKYLKYALTRSTGPPWASQS